MQRYITITIVILVALMAAGFAGWFFVLPESSPTPTGGSQVPIVPGGPTTVLVDTPPQSSSGNSQPQSPQEVVVPDTDSAFNSLFIKLGANRLSFEALPAASYPQLYVAYQSEFALYKKLYPEQPTPTLNGTEIDLNNDGAKEVMVVLNFPGFCGTAGCPLDVYRSKTNTNTPLLTTVAFEAVGVMAGAAGGYASLLLTSSSDGYVAETKRYSYTNGTYQPAESLGKWNGDSFKAPRR